MNKQTIRNVDLKGKRVLVRVDFNVPIEDGKITDDTRITAAVPTLKAILEQKPRSVVLMSHLGRPKDKPDPQYSMKPTVDALSKLLGKPVAFADDEIILGVRGLVPEVQRQLSAAELQAGHFPAAARTFRAGLLGAGSAAGVRRA